MRFRPKIGLGILIGVLVIAILFVSWKGPASPEGKYTADPRIGIVGDFWWELKDGRVDLVSEGNRGYTGRYAKQGDHWYWIDDRDRRGGTNILRIDSTWWRLRMVDEKNGEAWTWGVRRVW